MDDYLKPHRNLETERQLKTIIQKIQSLIHKPENDTAIRDMLREASKFVNAPNRVLDLEAIESYEGWTDLDGFVGELTMEVPTLFFVSKENFISVIQLVREVIDTEHTPNDLPLDYFMNFYREFFLLNFPDIGDDLFDELFENTPVDKLVDMAFP
ncbi:MAG: hypothetical protein HFG52_15990 [Lachnospiraceae bacterium]|nr:hypothetical protein [Lachnospiraceae bacterium]